MNKSFPNTFSEFSSTTIVSSPKPLEIRQFFFEHYLYPSPSKLSLPQIATIMVTLKSISQTDRIGPDVFVSVLSKHLHENDAKHLFLMHQLASSTVGELADIRSLGLFLAVQAVQIHSRHSISSEIKVKDFNIENRSPYQEAFKQQQGFSPLNSPRAKTMRVHGNSNECQQILMFLRSNLRQILKIISFNSEIDDEVIILGFQLINQKCIITDKSYNILSMIFQSTQPLSQLLFERNTRMLLQQVVDWTINNIGFNENEIYTLSGFTKSVTIKPIKSLPSQHLRIAQCEDSHIFIDHPIQTLSIQQCINCVVFVSSVAHITSVLLCDRITLCLTSTVLRISNTIDSSFYYFGSHAPVLMGDCRNITLGPHNGNTLRLLERVRETGVPITKRNAEIFAKPLILQGNQNIDFNIVTPEDICMLSLPEESFSALNYSLIEECGFDVERIGKELTDKKILSQPLILDRIFIPPLAPIEYQKAVFQRYKYFAELQTKIKAIAFKEEDSKLLSQAIQGNFREWLVTTGAIKPITDLVKLIDDQN